MAAVTDADGGRRDLDWDGCVNVRDLGGLPTADGRVTARGVLVRADNVRRLTGRGWADAWSYGIRTILDLRSDGERSGDAAVPREFHVATVSLFADFDGDPAYRAELVQRVGGRGAREANRVLYTEALQRNRPSFRAAFEATADTPEGGVLVHCAGGKDRTGVLAALLLRLADVPLHVVAADYERSEERLGIVDSAPSGVIEHVVEALEAEHGSAARFFVAAGVAEAKVERVRRRLAP